MNLLICTTALPAPFKNLFKRAIWHSQSLIPSVPYSLSPTTSPHNLILLSPSPVWFVGAVSYAQGQVPLQEQGPKQQKKKNQK